MIIEALLVIFSGYCVVGQLSAGPPPTQFSDLDMNIMSYYNVRPQRVKPVNEISDQVKFTKLAQGSPALANQFPFASSLSVNGVHACGGILIRPKVILTAGHCVTNFEDFSIKDPSTMRVQIGNVVRGEGTEYMVQQVVIPEVFNLNDSFLGDIALLELSSASNQSEALFSNETTGQTVLTAIGWGYTSETGVLSSSLLQTLLTKLSDDACAEFHKMKGLGEKPIDHFCAGDMNTGADTCRGDSGGPLLEGDFQVVGLTSYGAYDAKCGQVNSTGVYTSVPFWYPWILDTISLYNMDGLSKPSRLVTPDFNTCWEMGETGGMISNQVIESVGQCAEMCRTASRCTSWQWEFGSLQCTLDSSRDPPKKLASKFCHTGEVRQNVDKLYFVK